jgi:hypothetical protein
MNLPIHSPVDTPPTPRPEGGGYCSASPRRGDEMK